MPKINYWLDWENKIIKPNNQGLNDISWSEVENYPITVFCSSHDWPQIEIEERNKKIITDETKRTYQIGLATIKELRGASEEKREGMGSQAIKLLHRLVPDFSSNHPRTGQDFFNISNHWKFAPRFENLQQGTFEQVWKIDIKSCYANIMRNYPLPYKEPQLIIDPIEIETKLKESQAGFIAFNLKSPAIIKNNQIPFLPNSEGEIKDKTKGKWFIHTSLFKTFKKQYKIRGKIHYKNFWIFTHQKGCVDKFLNHCERIKQEDAKKGKMLANSLYGVLGKNNFSGYHYHPFMLAVNHLAILQTYYLYRQFKPEQVLAIRSDCIYIQGELPKSFLKEKDKYHLEHYQQVSLQGDTNIFIHDLGELKSFANGQERKDLSNVFSKAIKFS